MLFSLVSHSLSAPPYPYHHDCDHWRDISDQGFIEQELIEKTKYCYKIAGSFFINGKPIKTTIYDKDDKKGQAVGIGATIGGRFKDSEYVVKIESTTNRTITVIGSWAPSPDDIIFVTTNASVKDFELMDGAYKGDFSYQSFFYYFGTLGKVKITGTVGKGIKMANVFGVFPKVNRKEFHEDDVINEEGEGIVGISALSDYNNGSVKLNIENLGPTWVTPIDGYVTIKKESIYSSAAFGSFKLPVTPTPRPPPTVGIAVGSIALIVGILVICGLVYWCKHKKTAGDDNGDQEADP